MKQHLSVILLISILFFAAWATPYIPGLEKLFDPASEGGDGAWSDTRTDINSSASGTGTLELDGFIGDYLELIEVDSVDDLPDPAEGRTILFRLSSVDSLYWMDARGMIALVAEGTTDAATADAWPGDAPCICMASTVAGITTYYRFETEWS